MLLSPWVAFPSSSVAMWTPNAEAIVPISTECSPKDHAWEAGRSDRELDSPSLDTVPDHQHENSLALRDFEDAKQVNPLWQIKRE